MNRKYYPLFLDIGGQPVLVAGGGNVALRKARALVEADALVTVISPEFCDGLKEMADHGRLKLLWRECLPDDVTGARLVFAATGDPDINAEITGRAILHGIPANSADPPGAGDFIVPSTIHEDGLTVAISTGGISPALAKKLRIDIEARIGTGYAPFLKFLGYARDILKQSVHGQSARAAILAGLIESDLIESFRQDPERALAQAENILNYLVERHSEN